MASDDAGALAGRRTTLLLVADAVAPRLFGELALDLAHLGEAKHAPDAGRIDGVFGRQHDGDEDRRRRRPR